MRNRIYKTFSARRIILRWPITTKLNQFYLSREPSLMNSMTMMVSAPMFVM